MITEDEQPLTSAELRSMRDIIERDRRAQWLWSSLRVWAIWVASILGAWIIGWESLAKVVKTLAGK